MLEADVDEILDGFGIFESQRVALRLVLLCLSQVVLELHSRGKEDITTGTVILLRLTISQSFLNSVLRWYLRQNLNATPSKAPVVL